MELISAQEAFLRTKTVRAELPSKQIEEVAEEINRAIGFGKFELSYKKDLFLTTVEEIKRSGYRVTKGSGSCFDEEIWRISW